MRQLSLMLIPVTFFLLTAGCVQPSQETIHVFEVKEIELTCRNDYDNPYTDVECWVELEGPGFKDKVFGFWNGERQFLVRLAATSPGIWKWRSYASNKDSGLNGITGNFRAVSWTEEEIKENPNRRGFIGPTPNGRALEYADGTPFFLLGDTWWSASTWRFPFKGTDPEEGYVPAEGIGFEEAVQYRKGQGYNTIAMIASYPNWKVDQYPSEYTNSDGIGVRQAWEKFGQNTAKDMHDEAGNMPFEPWEKSDIIANFDRINPLYFQSLDTKIRYLSDMGFVTMLETVRRDHGPSWKAYFEWPESYSRYVQYIKARYGAYNIIFSGIHLDWIPEHFSLTADEFNEALTYNYKKYGGLPFKQPSTTLIHHSTYIRYGHGEDAPWLTMHSVGNSPRNHGMTYLIEELFSLDPPYPVANLEAYYPGWQQKANCIVAGELAERNSERDNYFARAQMYGSVLSGGLAGHIYGTGAYDGTTTGESREESDRPYIWDALRYPSGMQMQYLSEFILSEGNTYQQCTPARQLLEPGKADGAQEDGLDGWSFMLLSPGKETAFLYFENKAEIPSIRELAANKTYLLHWYHPVTGKWLDPQPEIRTDEAGALALKEFPDGEITAGHDWCLKIIGKER